MWLNFNILGQIIFHNKSCLIMDYHPPPSPTKKYRNSPSICFLYTPMSSPLNPSLLYFNRFRILQLFFLPRRWLSQCCREDFFKDFGSRVVRIPYFRKIYEKSKNVWKPILYADINHIFLNSAKFYSEITGLRSNKVTKWLESCTKPQEKGRLRLRNAIFYYLLDACAKEWFEALSRNGVIKTRTHWPLQHKIFNVGNHCLYIEI